MTQSTTWARGHQSRFTGAHRLALFAGVVATCGALAILLADPIVTGNWTLTHFLLPVVVTITIVAGHLVHYALRDRKILSAAGFALVFVIGTGLTVYSSVGSQAEKNGNKAANAAAHNDAIRSKRDAIADAKQKLAENEAMQTAQQRAVNKACESGDGKLCKGARASLSVYTSAVKGDRQTITEAEAALASLGGELTARPKAEAFATAAAVFGFDKKKVETAATILEPFAYSLLLELTAIIALGYAFSRRQHSAGVTPAAAAVAAANDDDAQPLPPGGGRRRVSTKARAEADVIQLVARGPLPDQQTLAHRWGCHSGTASKWLADFERRGLITRSSIGRCKVVAAA